MHKLEICEDTLEILILNEYSGVYDVNKHSDYPEYLDFYENVLTLHQIYPT